MLNVPFSLETFSGFGLHVNIQFIQVVVLFLFIMLFFNIFRWVHVVCALYVPGVAFGDIDKLRPVTLTEMNYSKYGAKASILNLYRCTAPVTQVLAT